MVCAAAILVLLGTGYLLAGDYGMSWDEPSNSAFGRQGLDTYLTLQPPSEWYGNLESKGPFFVAIVEAMVPLWAAIRTSWLEADARHFSYFLSLPLAAGSFYAVARRVSSAAAALAATALFVTQPLLFGHAFINPKDTPFLAFFLLSVWSGLKLVESVGSNGAQQPVRSRAFRIATWALPGVVMGVTTSMRLFGPFAGVLVSGWGLARSGRRIALPLIVYWATAVGACYLTWPYLWGDPFHRFHSALKIMVSFPWDNVVLYRGLVYAAPDLPWHYLPFTTVIQLTEPLLLLAVLGSAVGLLRLAKDRSRLALYGMFLCWTALPYSVALLLQTTVYDNSRQFLFALPPLFVAAALAFDALFSRFRSSYLRAGLVGLAVLPGLISIVQLHPYEYIYYNSLVGGVPGAYRVYELDYWGTSYREAMEVVNQAAPAGATVEIAGPWRIAIPFAREDLRVVRLGRELPPDAQLTSYFLSLTRRNMDAGFAQHALTIAEIKVLGATLAIVKSTSAR